MAINVSAALYIGSRGIAAAGNLLAVAIFTRMAGPAEYGSYVLIFAWSMIAYGFTAQWMRFAYFGLYQSGRVNEYIASLASLHAVALGILALVFAALIFEGSFNRAFLLSIFAVVMGMTIYESAFEVTRTLQNATAAARSMVLRTSLIITLGSATLWYGGGAVGLGFAIGLAHLLAAIPCLMTFSGVRLAHGSRSASVALLRYGWPLLLSFGVIALGQSVDRLLLGHFAGTEALGPYGAVADFLRQSFSVVGESIILALGTAAKHYANEGNVQASNHELRKSFNACLATAVSGALFFFVFGDLVVRILLGPKFVEPSRELIPFFAIAFAFMTMRNFYFGQVIYFARDSRLEPFMSLFFVLLSSLMSLQLIPHYGPKGAAISLMITYSISCAVYIVAGRRLYKMPIDPVGTGVICIFAILFMASSWIVDTTFGQVGVALAIKAVLFVAMGVLIISRLDILRPNTQAADIKSEPAMTMNTTRHT